jgi:hypothetical protein
MGDLLVPADEAVPSPLDGLQEDRRVRPVAERPEVGQVVGAGIAGRHIGQSPFRAAMPSRQDPAHGTASLCAGRRGWLLRARLCGRVTPPAEALGRWGRRLPVSG